MIRKDLDDISDYDYENVITPCEEKIKKELQDKFLNEYVAFNIFVFYNGDALWDEPFELQVKDAIESLYQFTTNDCNFKKIKEILKSKYKLKVVCESPFNIEEMKS